MTNEFYEKLAAKLSKIAAEASDEKGATRKQVEDIMDAVRGMGEQTAIEKPEPKDTAIRCGSCGKETTTPADIKSVTKKSMCSDCWDDSPHNPINQIANLANTLKQAGIDIVDELNKIASDDYDDEIIRNPDGTEYEGPVAMADCGHWAPKHEVTPGQPCNHCKKNIADAKRFYQQNKEKFKAQIAKQAHVFDEDELPPTERTPQDEDYENARWELCSGCGNSRNVHDLDMETGECPQCRQAGAEK
jgi:hypothetical protein